MPRVLHAKQSGKKDTSKQCGKIHACAQRVLQPPQCGKTAVAVSLVLKSQACAQCPRGHEASRKASDTFPNIQHLYHHAFAVKSPNLPREDRQNLPLLQSSKLRSKLVPAPLNDPYQTSPPPPLLLQLAFTGWGGNGGVRRGGFILMVSVEAQTQAAGTAARSYCRVIQLIAGDIIIRARPARAALHKTDRPHVKE